MTLGLLAFAPARPEPTPWRHTLFLQFQGASLTWVPTPEEENAALGLSMLSKFEGSELPPYDGEARDRLAVLQAVRDHFAGFGVRVVAERPNDWVPYTMAVIGGQWDDTAATSVVRGVAPTVDCGRVNQRHTVFAFVGSEEPTVQQATTISQEAGHAFGLDHVLGDGLVMSYDFAAAVSQFSSGCVDLCERACQGRDSIFCEAEHTQYCDVGMQDSRAELLATFGDDQPDTEAPSVQIVAPADGTVLSPGSDLEVEVEITDNYGGVGWRFELVLDGNVVAEEIAFDRALTWSLSTLPEGEYEVRVLAEDHADHQTIATANVAVTDDATGDTAGTSDSAADTTGGGTAALDSSSSASQGDGTDGSGPPQSGDDGCGCRMTPKTAWWAWLVPLSLRRRRRTRVDAL